MNVYAGTLVSTRLPYEVLRKIILYAYEYTPGSLWGPVIYLRLVSPPIVASQVCRWWRYCLLSDPLMWACICIPPKKPKNINWLSEILKMLRRSGSAPLRVCIQLGPSHPPIHEDTSVIISAIFQHFHRFEILCLIVDQDTNVHHNPLLRQVLTYLQQPAPKLQTLCFSSEHFFPNLFSRDTSNVKTIQYSSLHEDFRELHCHVFHNLSELSLSYDIGRRTFRLDLRLFLNFINLSPCLQSLHVKMQQADILIPLGDDIPECTLPHLRRLVLQYITLPSMDLFLKHVDFPQTVQWRIDYDLRGITEAQEWSRISQFHSQADFASLRVYHSSLDNTFQFKGIAGEGDKYYDIGRFDGSRLTYISSQYSYPFRQFTTLWKPLINSVNPSHIKHLHLSHRDSRSSSPVFRTIFMSLSDIESLVVSMSSGELLLECLIELIADSEKAAASENSTNRAMAVATGLSLTQDSDRNSILGSGTISDHLFSDPNRDQPSMLSRALPCPHLCALTNGRRNATLWRYWWNVEEWWKALNPSCS